MVEKIETLLLLLGLVGILAVAAERLKLPFPILLVLAGLGIVSSLWTLATFPLIAALLPFHLFWGASAVWCALTVWASWPAGEDRQLA